MSDPSSPTETGDRDFARDLAVECVERYEEEGEAAIDAICKAHPEHAAEIRRRVDKLREIGLLGETEAEPEFPEQLGDYRLIECLGRGGMGVVFRAEQVSLGREVALKLIRPDSLFFGGARERFQREVEAIARLQHPGIVPVYAVGIEGDVPYFAMELVRGCSLEDVLEDCARIPPEERSGSDFARSVATRCGVELDQPPAIYSGRWEHTALRITQGVAEALQHAHDRGIVHRDVKPSNVMVTPEGRVMLLDFGLASSVEAPRMTMTGSRLGSPHYMSPEQARGAAVQPTWDVYSLGVTLYELLTCKRAYDDESMAALVVAIERGDATPPRQHDPKITWEAQTICQTAMEVDPERRYPTAAALASDLGHALAHRPIAARPASGWRRLRRWCQRHPTRAVGLALGSIVVVFGPTAFGLQQFAAARRIQEQVERADQNLITALDAIERMLVRVGASELRDVPLMDNLRRDLLADATALFDQLVANDGGRSERLTERALECYGKLASVLRDLGEYDRSSELFARVIPQLRAAASPDDPKSQLALASGLDSRARLRRETGEPEAATDDVRAAATITGRILQDAPTPAVVTQHIRTLVSLGRTLAIRGDYTGAEAAYHDAQDVVREHESSYAEDSTFLDVAASLSLRLGDLYLDTERFSLAIESYERGGEIARQAIAVTPDVHNVRASLAALVQNLAIACGRDGDPARAHRHFEEALDVRRQLAREFPYGPVARHELAKALISVGNNLRRLGGANAVELMGRRYDEALEVITELALVYPESSSLIATRAAAYTGVGFVAAMRKEMPEATAHFEAAVVDFRRATEVAGPESEWAFHLSMAYYGLMMCLKDMPVMENYRRSAEVAATAVSLEPPRWDDYELAAQHLFTAAQAAAQDPDVTPEVAAANRESYLVAIEEALRTAVRAGFGEQATTMTSNAPFAEPRFRAAAQPTSSNR